MNARKTVAAPLVARDPGRARLTLTSAISAGVLVSALIASWIVNTTNADHGFLVVGIFLSLQSGGMAKDPTGRGRLLTTALMLPTVLAVVALASALLTNRVALIALFILTIGIAVWVRKFGPRATAIGSVAFMGYFFTLLMEPKPAQLPVFLLLVGCAVTTQIGVRALLLLTRPRRRIHLLMKELRAASGAALQASRHPTHHASLRSRLARLDDVAGAIDTWQRDFPTERYVSCDAVTLQGLVLDARVDTEEVCYKLVRIQSTDHSSPAHLNSAHLNSAHLNSAHPANPQGTPMTSGGDGRELREALQALQTVLAEQSDVTKRRQAMIQAEQFIRQEHPSEDEELILSLLARATIAQNKLRDIEQTPESPSAEARPPAPPSPASKAPVPTAHSWKPVPWRKWEATSRMAVQAMVAALLASGVGEAISASRWYWAVITAFVVFIGATTRSSILTRAFRRVAGTALGIGFGLLAVTLAHDNTTGLILICLFAVFGMMYFGPLNYIYQASFITIMLVAMYRMLGVLNQQVLELRLGETLAGACIGVICAYLILSTSSKPVLAETIDGYFAALDHLLDEAIVRTEADTPQQGSLIKALRGLELAQANTDKALAAMATAFLLTNPHRESEAVHLMYITTRSAARLTQSAEDPKVPLSQGILTEGTRDALVSAITQVRATAGTAHRSLEATAPQLDQHMGGRVADNLERLDAPITSPAGAAILALARMEWALGQIISGSSSAGHNKNGVSRL